MILTATSFFQNERFVTPTTTPASGVVGVFVVTAVLACVCVGLSLLLLVREERREREGKGGKDKETSIRIFMSINWKGHNYM
jgi:hypothetical protein